VSEGVITTKQLEEAYRLGRQQRQGVGRILLSLGYAGQSDLAKAMARRLRLKFVELGADDVDPDVANLVDKKLLRRYGMLPLRVEDGRLVVAMKDPANLHAIEDLRMLSGYTISPVVVAASDLRRVSAMATRSPSFWKRHRPRHRRKTARTWSCGSTGAPRVRRP
jgi:type IV pilus assembly protein PilB